MVTVQPALKVLMKNGADVQGWSGLPLPTRRCAREKIGFAAALAVQVADVLGLRAAKALNGKVWISDVFLVGLLFFSTRLTSGFGFVGEAGVLNSGVNCVC